MPYVGYGVENSTVDLAEQTITASGNLTETLSRSVNEDTELLVFVNNILKDTASYSIGGTLKNELTFSVAPTAGEAIVVRYLQKSVDIVAVAPAGVNTFNGRTGTVNLTSQDLTDLVDKAAISSNAVGLDELGSSGTVDSDRAVTNNHIRDNAVTGAKVQSDANVDNNRAIGTDHIKDSAVATAKIADDGVTPKKLALKFADETAANAAGLTEGDMYYDEAQDELRYHNGTAWQDIQIGGTTTDVGDLPISTTYTGIRYAPDITTTSHLDINPSTEYAYTFCDKLTVDTGHVLNIANGKNLKVGVFANLGGFTGGTIGGGGAGQATDLDGLTDVIISGPANKQVLRYNGTSWVNTQLTYSDISGQPFTQIQSDWNQADTSNLAYIVNKPNVVLPNSSPTFNDLTVSGDLNVIGTTTTNNVDTLNVNNNEIVLNNNVGHYVGNATNGSAVVSGIPSTSGITQGAAVTIVSGAASLTLSGSATVATIDSGTQITLNVNFGGTGSATGIKLAIPTTATQNASIVVERSAQTDVRVRWNETNNRWEFSNDGNAYHNIPIPSEYGDYNNLQNLPNLAASQQQTDWNSTSGVTSIANKPNIPDYLGELANVSSTAGINNSPTITTGHVLKWNGTMWAPGLATAAGQVGLGGRGDLAVASASLADNATDSNVNITGYKSYVLLAITTSDDSWVRVYSTAAARTADLNRSEGTDPAPGTGVIAEVRVNGTQMITPGTIGFNYESTPTTDIYLSVTNRSGTTQQLTTTLKAVQLEA